MQQELIRQTPLWAENWPIAYSVIQAIVILLVVVLIAALMSFIERRLLGLMARPLWSEPCRSWGDVPDRCRHVENHVQRRLDTKVC